MSQRPSDASEEPEAVDPVMLAVLANRGRTTAVLSAEEERLVDAWATGALAPEEAERAAELVRRNSLAAERVLERRLLDAANQGSPVPQSLEARILKSAPSARSSPIGGWWRSLGRRQWLAIATVAAAACVAAIAVAPMLQQSMGPGAPVQIALATFSDRSALFEPRMRGPIPPAPSEQRFRDVEIPTTILAEWIAASQRRGNVSAGDIDAYLPIDAAADSRPVRLIIDSALRERIPSGDRRDRVPARIYDLKDSRTVDIRNMIRGIPDDVHPYLLTLQP